jgi:hypothetical protein
MPKKTCKPWNPVNKKNKELWEAELKDKSKEKNSSNWININTKPHHKVIKSLNKVFFLLPNIKSILASLIQKLEPIKKIVPIQGVQSNSGIPHT